MTYAWLWFRRGAGPWLFVPMAAFMVTTALMNRPWSLEFDWGTRYLAASVLIFSPLVAAACAFDVARRIRPTLYDIALGARRGTWVIVSPAMAVVAWAVLASTASWGTISVVVARNGGIGPSDPWVFLETVAAFLAAGLLGALLGLTADGLVAVAGAAGAVLLSAVLLGGQGVKLFQVASSTGSMLGIERTPTRAGLAISANVGVAIAAWVLIASRTHASRTPRIWTVGAAVSGTFLATLGTWWPVADSEYRPSIQPPICVGDAVVVCGPEKASKLWRQAAIELSAAREKLSGSGLQLPTRFAVVRGDAVTDLPAGTSQLDYDTSALRNGRLSVDMIASAFSTPRPCAAFFSAAESEPYLKLADTTRSWLLVQLTQGSAGTAPEAVRRAYQRLSTCDVIR